MRTADQIRSSMLALLDSRLSGVRTQAGEPIVDLVDAVSIEQAKDGVLVEYLRRMNSIAGWREILGDEQFRSDLAFSLGVSTRSLDNNLARELGVPGTITTDIDAIFWSDLSRYAESLGRPRKLATFATGTLRLYLSSNVPMMLARGATVRSTRTNTSYETAVDLVGVQPGLDLSTNRYYVDVTVRARQAGRVGNASRNTVTSIVTSMPSVIAVSNLTALEGGADAETNEVLLDALAEGITSTLNTASGLRALFMGEQGVVDVLVVGPGNSLMTRAAAGAVDVYILGASLMTAASVVRVLVEGETVVLPLQPVRSISSVTAGSPLSEGNAFTSYADTGAYQGSVKARTSLTWKSVALGGPAAGTDVSIVYTYNDLIRQLQRLIDEDPDKNVPGSDLLVREAVRIPLYLDLKVVPYSGVLQVTAEAAVSAALSNLIDQKLLGQNLDYSDVLVAAAEATVDGVPVVDRINDLRFGVTAEALSTADLTIGENQYVRVEAVTFRT